VNKENKKQKIYEKNWFAIGLIVLVTIFTFLNTFENKFIYEDYNQIVNNDFIKSWANISVIFSSDLAEVFSPQGYKGYKRKYMSGYYRPLFPVSFLIDYSIWGLNAAGFHFTNLLLHLLNCILIYFIVELLVNGDKKLALFTSLLFAVHPVHTEVVTYISGRDYALSFLFYLIAFLSFIKGNLMKSRRVYYQIFSLFFFMFALLTKEITATLPLILLLSSFCFTHKNHSTAAIIKRIIPYFVVLGFYIFLRKMVLNEIVYNNFFYGGSLYATFLTMSRVIVFYIRLLFLPVCLKLEYVFPISISFLGKPSPVFSILIIFLIIFAAIKTAKRSKLIFFSIFSFFIMLLPVSQLIPLRILMAERYLYFASFGFCLFLAKLIVDLYKRDNKFFQRGGFLLFTVFIMGYSARTVMRNLDWKDNFTLWSKTVKDSPKSSRAYYNLGIVYEKRGWYNRAINAYKQAMRNGVNSEILLRLGNMYYREKQYNKAISQYKHALEIDPIYELAHYNLGVVYEKMSWYDQAIDKFKETLKLDPDFYEAHKKLRTICKKGK